MTWFERSANESEAAKEHVVVFLAVDFDFPSGHARFWTGYGLITIGGNSYVGAGELGRISAPSERTGLDAQRREFELSGADISPALVSESDIDGCFGREVTVYEGYINNATGQLVAEPEVEWEGLIDGVRRSDGENPSIQVGAEHRLVVLDRSTGSRFTNEHQQQNYPGDTGFSQVIPSINREIVWGGKIVRTSGGSGGGGGTRTPRRDVNTAE